MRSHLKEGIKEHHPIQKLKLDITHFACWQKPRLIKRDIFVFEYTLTHAFELGLEHDIVTNIAKLEQLVMVGILLDDGGRVRGSHSQDACRSFRTWQQSTNWLLLHWNTSLLTNSIAVSRWRRHCR